MTAYAVIAADCPWAPKDKLPGKTRGAARQYPVIPTAALLVYPRAVGIEFTADAILFFWRLASMQDDALAVVRAWGFTVKSEVVWRKLTKDGLPWFGMGRTVRASHETCLIATRGRASRLIRSHSVRSVFDAKVPVDEQGRYIHSAKPDEFFAEIVEPLVGVATVCGPFLELFARKRRAGWHQIGDQLPPAVEAA